MPCVSLKLIGQFFCTTSCIVLIYDVFIAVWEFKICKHVLTSPSPLNFLIPIAVEYTCETLSTNRKLDKPSHI